VPKFDRLARLCYYSVAWCPWPCPRPTGGERQCSIQHVLVEENGLLMTQTVASAPPVATITTPSTHTVATLIGFQSQLEACVALTTNNIVDLPQSLEEIYQHWRTAQKQSRKPPKHTSSYGLPTVQSLPSHMRDYEQEVKSRPTYQRHYQGVAEYRVVLVPVCLCWLLRVSVPN
jgi:hypothetical protein